MARIRSVHPDICTSETMAGLDAELERTFVRLWTHCDDFGKCFDNVRLIKAAYLPVARRHDRRAGRRPSRRARGAWAALPLRSRRKAMPSHQFVGRVPTPATTHGQQSPGPFREQSWRRTGSFRERSVLERRRRRRRRGRETSAPNDFVPSPASLEWASNLGFTREALDHETSKFLDWCRSKRATSHDWQARWRLWIGRCDPPGQLAVAPVKPIGRCGDCGLLEFDCECGTTTPVAPA